MNLVYCVVLIICMRDNIARHTVYLLLHWSPRATLSPNVITREKKAPGLWLHTNVAAVLIVNKGMTS